MAKNKNRAKILMILGTLLIIASLTLPSALSISTLNPLTFDFSEGTAPWTLNLAGSGNTATFTPITTTPTDPHVRLTCTAYNKEANGYVGAIYRFQLGELNVGEGYTVTFDYLSNTKFNFQYISQNTAWEIIDQYYTTCSASTVWTSATLTIPPIQNAAHYTLSINVYNVGSVNFDTIKIVPNTTPTPTPTPTTTPEPQPTEAKVTLGGIGGGIIMTYNGLILPANSIAIETYYVPFGTTVNLAANPDQGNEFSKWEINGEVIMNNPTQITINADTSIKAVFSTAPLPHDESDWVFLLQLAGALLVAAGLLEWVRKKP